MPETIAAIATPQAAGGIGIIRISGPDAIQTGDRIFRAVSGDSLCEKKGYTAHYGHAFDAEGDIDEVIALLFRAPKSYTGEDVVELSCHGGLAVLQQVLRAAYAAGARPAEAGEFTRRAFLNGKIDLAQAESVMSLISAQGKQSARIALSAREGALSREIDGISHELTVAAAHMAAWADYPEEDLPQLEFSALSETFARTASQLEHLLSRFDAGQAVCEGIDTVIAGRPNVGKSTLMNLLAGTNRSIVTEIAGTTRDIVEETVRLGDVLLRLADTAGLRRTDDPVEQIGVQLARQRLDRAELLFAVFDASAPLDAEDRALLSLCKEHLSIAVINKTDLPCVIETQEITTVCGETVFIRAAQGDGYEALAAAAARLLGTDQLDPSAAMLTTERQRTCCTKALSSLRAAREALDAGMTLDAVTVCIQDTIDLLLELTGKRAVDLILDEVFSRFCVGK